MVGIAWLRLLPLLVPLGLYAAGGVDAPLAIFTALFFLLGAIANSLTIAVIGLLMEISPPEDQPAYSGYFNAVTAPAFLLPLLAGGIAQFFGLELVFALSLLAAAGQTFFVSRIRTS